MGDRCEITVQCRRADLDRAMPGWHENLEFSMDLSPSADSPVLHLYFEEVDEARLIGDTNFPDGIPFVADHGAGGNYVQGKIISDGVRLDRSDYVDGCFLFEVGDDGNPRVTARHRRFWAKLKRLDRYLETGRGLRRRRQTADV